MYLTHKHQVLNRGSVLLPHSRVRLVPEDLGTSSALSTRGCSSCSQHRACAVGFFFPRFQGWDQIQRVTSAWPRLCSQPWPRGALLGHFHLLPGPRNWLHLGTGWFFFVLKQHFGIKEDKVTRSAPPKPCSGPALLVAGLQHSFCALSWALLCSTAAWDSSTAPAELTPTLPRLKMMKRGVREASCHLV